MSNAPTKNDVQQWQKFEALTDKPFHYFEVIALGTDEAKAKDLNEEIEQELRGVIVNQYAEYPELQIVGLNSKSGFSRITLMDKTFRMQISGECSLDRNLVGHKLWSYKLEISSDIPSWKRASMWADYIGFALIASGIGLAVSIALSQTEGFSISNGFFAVLFVLGFLGYWVGKEFGQIIRSKFLNHFEVQQKDSLDQERQIRQALISTFERLTKLYDNSSNTL